MADFLDADLQGSRFERADLTGSEFRATVLRGVRFRGVLLQDVVVRGSELVNVDISGEIEGLTINGVDVGPLVEAELDKAYPDRAKMRPTDAAGFRKAWDVVERLWDETVDRASHLDPGLLHQSVAGEWSFIETLRHLVFATDAWIRRGIMGDPSPWDALDLPWDDMADTPGVPRDRDVRPSLDEVAELRRDRMSGVREFLDGLTDEFLAGQTEPVEGPGWPEPRSYPVRAMPARGPQRGVGAPPVRRARPGRPGFAARLAGLGYGAPIDGEGHRCHRRRRPIRNRFRFGASRRTCCAQRSTPTD